MNNLIASDVVNTLCIKDIRTMLLTNKNLNLNTTIPNSVLNYAISLFEPKTILNNILHPSQQKLLPGYINKLSNLNSACHLKGVGKTTYLFLSPDYCFTKQYGSKIVNDSESKFTIGCYFSDGIAKDIYVPSLEDNDVLSYKLLSSLFSITNADADDINKSNDNLDIECIEMKLNYKPKILLTNKQDWDDNVDVRNLQLLNEFKINSRDKLIRKVKNAVRYISDRRSYDNVGFLDKQPPVIVKDNEVFYLENSYLLTYKSQFGSASANSVNQATASIDDDSTDIKLDETTIEKMVMDLVDKSDRTIIGSNVKMLVLKVVQKEPKDLILNFDLKYELIKILQVSQQSMVVNTDYNVFYNWNTVMRGIYDIGRIFYNYSIVDIMNYLFLPNGMMVPDLNQDEIDKVLAIINTDSVFYKIVVIFLKMLDKLNIKTFNLNNIVN